MFPVCRSDYCRYHNWRRRALLLSSMEQEARDRISRPLPDDAEPDKTAGRNWYLEASLEDILALGRKPDQPIDHKVESDALYDYLDKR